MQSLKTLEPARCLIERGLRAFRGISQLPSWDLFGVALRHGDGTERSCESRVDLFDGLVKRRDAAAPMRRLVDSVLTIGQCGVELGARRLVVDHDQMAVPAVTLSPTATISAAPCR